jgi:ribosome biogenesis GTPase A
MTNNAVNNALSILKLAHATRQFNFVNKAALDSFLHLLYLVTKPFTADRPYYSSFAEVIGIMQTLDISSYPELQKYAVPVIKKYRQRKCWFSRRVCYKHLLALEACYIYFLVNQNKPAQLIIELSLLLRLRQEEQAIISKYINALVSDKINDLPNITRNSNIKGFPETVKQLTTFISREFQYHHLPRVNVSMFSTMSAGKSTFINALLGHYYLPTKNEACTAKIVSISDDDSLEHVLGYAIKEGQRIFCGYITANIIKEWNSDDNVTEINIEGDFDKINGKTRVFTLHDTPGVNYSGSVNHREITIRHLEDIKPDIVIFLLDATQMETTDFSKALQSLKKLLNREKPFFTLFVVNKADEVDPEKENIAGMIASAKEILEKEAFPNPVIIPVSSRAAWLLKRVLKGETEWTQKEKNDFALFMYLFGDGGENFCKAAIGFSCDPVTIENTNTGEGVLSIGTKSYSVMTIQRALLNTGMPVVESFLNSYKESENEQSI